MAGELHFAVSRTVRGPLEAIWQVLGDFGTEHRWSKQFDHCARDTDVVGVGTVRTCTLPKALMGRAQVREVVTEYGPGPALGYALDGAAGPFASAASRWSASRASPDSTVVTVEGFLTARNLLVRVLIWPLAKPTLRRLTRRVIGELEVFVAGAAAT